MLEGDSLSFQYRSNADWIFHQACISIAPGQILGLRGPSGCGKTTFGKILSGFLNPVSGYIRVDGMPLPAKGCCPVQLISQHPELSVNPKWRIRKIIQEGNLHTDAMVKELGLDPEWMIRFPHEVSGGELQRIIFARALGPCTRYLIADEISTMLDALTQAQIWDMLLHHARRKNIGVLAISQDNALLEKVCDRVLDMKTIQRSMTKP